MSARTEAAPLPEIGRVRAFVDFYTSTMRYAVQAQLQYRVENYLYMIGMIAEPVIYLVVWSTIADQRGGAIEGVTTGQIAAYYIVWTLVRNMNIVFTPYGWEWRIREGDRVTIRVPKDETARVTARLLAELQIADLTVEEPPIDDVIETVFAQERIE